MNLTCSTVFESEILRIRNLVARPDSEACGEIDRAAVDQLVLPVAGVFARHDGPTRCVIANPSHALFFAAGQPYRISYPGCVGDEVMVFEFAAELLDSTLGDTVAADSLRAPWIAGDSLLPPAALLERGLLWRRLMRGGMEPLAVEEIGLGLLASSLRAACTDGRREDRARRSVTALRRRKQIDAVKEAISVHPERPWTLAALAGLAHTTPCHLSRLFRQEVGAPIHQYLVRTRLAKALEAVLGADGDLTSIALDAGFASHSHFTASFRTLFGLTPARLRKFAIA